MKYLHGPYTIYLLTRYCIDINALASVGTRIMQIVSVTFSNNEKSCKVLYLEKYMLTTTYKR